MSGHYEVRQLVANDLEFILDWRNHPDIRINMFSQKLISWDEHQNWFNQTSLDPTKRLLIAEGESGPIGYAQFSNLSNPDAVTWGFYIRPDAPRGTGILFGTSILNYGFHKLRIKKIFSEVLVSNTSSIKFHLKLGFSQHREAAIKNMYGMTHKIVIFELEKKAWSLNPD